MWQLVEKQMNILKSVFKVNCVIYYHEDNDNDYDDYYFFI